VECGLLKENLGFANIQTFQYFQIAREAKSSFIILLLQKNVEITA
jgi:hypothetical protein